MPTETVIRFAVGDGASRRAATWKCWAQPGKGRSDVYLVCRELRGALKTSLHESGRWHSAWSASFVHEHVAEQLPSLRADEWQRPEQAPGLTLAVQIVTPRAAVNVPMPPAVPADLRWLPIPDDGSAIETSLFLTRPEAQVTGWPGWRAMGTALVGDFRLDSGEHVWLVYRVVPATTFRVSLRPRFFRGHTIADLKGPGLRGLFVAVGADGRRTIFEAVGRGLGDAD